MNRIYLVTGSKHSAIVVCRDRGDINTEMMGSMGDVTEIKVYEIGMAHPETPPGCMLIGDTMGLTRIRPLGKDAT